MPTYKEVCSHSEKTPPIGWFIYTACQHLINDGRKTLQEKLIFQQLQVQQLQLWSVLFIMRALLLLSSGNMWLDKTLTANVTGLRMRGWNGATHWFLRHKNSHYQERTLCMYSVDLLITYDHVLTTLLRLKLATVPPASPPEVKLSIQAQILHFATHIRLLTYTLTVDSLAVFSLICYQSSKWNGGQNIYSICL